MAKKKTTNKKVSSKKKTSDALAIIDSKLYDGKPDRQDELDKARADDAVARKIYQLRSDAGLSQREFAKRVGTTASVICRLEDADYEGHSMAMLRKIAKAFNKRVEIRFVSIKKSALAQSGNQPA
ncbi:MAG: transcriptional regulator [Blastopirellula sp.]|nr:MAG: transcriptional regulator [Blastopirellula sp.]